MSVFEMAKRYYPRLWSRERLEMLADAGRLTKGELETLLADKAQEIPVEE